jgi:hypothetical protein
MPKTVCFRPRLALTTKPNSSIHLPPHPRAGHEVVVPRLNHPWPPTPPTPSNRKAAQHPRTHHSKRSATRSPERTEGQPTYAAAAQLPTRAAAAVRECVWVMRQESAARASHVWLLKWEFSGVGVYCQASKWFRMVRLVLLPHVVRSLCCSLRLTHTVVPTPAASKRVVSSN